MKMTGTMEMADSLDRCNVVWDSPSRDSSGSMPLGNGDLAANVWVESGGDLLLLLAKSDAWDENSINLKLGRIRIALSPYPFRPGAPLRQMLDLRTATIDIIAGPSGAAVHLRIWVDANQPVIRVEADGEQPFELRATLEIWRTQDRTIKTQTSDLFKRLGGPDPHLTIVSADRILPSSDGRIVWCHHNEPREHDGYDINLRLQGLGEFLDQMPHPLRGRTFGAAMVGARMRSIDATTLVSDGPRKEHRLAIQALTLHPATVERWREHLDRAIAEGSSPSPGTPGEGTEWDRSQHDLPPCA